MIVVSQDGNCFYNDTFGGLLYKSRIQVRDFNLEAAELARRDFEMHAEQIGLKYHFQYSYNDDIVSI
jgi:hypothetical protein